MKPLSQGLIEEMFDDWLWEKYSGELHSKAIKEVEKEEGFWKSLWGCNQKIKDRQWKLFEELKNKTKRDAEEWECVQEQQEVRK